MLCGCLLLTSVPIARIGRRIEEGCLFYKSWVQRWIGGISVTAKIRNDVPSSEKETKEKPKKERKEKGLPFQPDGDGLSRFCRRKLCPEGFIFEGQTAKPPDLDGPSETGYLCGLFVFVYSYKMPSLSDVPERA